MHKHTVWVVKDTDGYDFWFPVALFRNFKQAQKFAAENTATQHGFDITQEEMAISLTTVDPE